MKNITPQDLIKQLTDAHQRTCALVDHLTEEQWVGPKLPTVNPLRWEIGHTAYFYEYWILRKHFGEPPLIENIDKLFDSIHIEHETRWDLDLPTIQHTIEYIQAVKDKVIAYLRNGEDDSKRDYLTQYAIFHEDMHCEAFTYTRQTLAYPTPKTIQPSKSTLTNVSDDQDVFVPGGEFSLGASQADNHFVFDNEKWAHTVEVTPFYISKYAVTNKQFMDFVDDGGYQNARYWDKEGWAWKQTQEINYPIYWRKSEDKKSWERRWFDQWYPINLVAAVANINWYEARAYCVWASRRLPSELEWEVAAAGEPNKDHSMLSSNKRLYPWGDGAFNKSFANLDGSVLGTINVDDLSQGDSAFGCRQMLGNVWEWTDSLFAPYPGFKPDMYADYSEPLFSKTRVLRGGCWTTRSRLIRNTWRNYYAPERNDIFSGFRTCALHE